MTKADTARIIGTLVTAYPKFEKFKDEEYVKSMIDLWAGAFIDDDFVIVNLAVMKCISICKWLPNVADVREIVADITHPDLIPPDQAWTAVSDLLYAVGEYNFDDAHRNLPALIARTVDTIGWNTLYRMHCGSCRGNKDGADRLAFMELYKPAYERARQNACCTSSLVKKIDVVKQYLSDGGVAQLEDAQKRRRLTEERLNWLPENIA